MNTRSAFRGWAIPDRCNMFAVAALLVAPGTAFLMLKNVQFSHRDFFSAPVPTLQKGGLPPGTYHRWGQEGRDFGHAGESH
jgi:hypothetical protein